MSCSRQLEVTRACAGHHLESTTGRDFNASTEGPNLNRAVAKIPSAAVRQKVVLLAKPSPWLRMKIGNLSIATPSRLRSAGPRVSRKGFALLHVVTARSACAHP
ncbi:hypothetical protein DXM26_23435 [Agrobacterium tumefaciens]|nr:hypothetical protein DXM26_23435 [Agrobacterium tumefaciens]